MLRNSVQRVALPSRLLVDQLERGGACPRSLHASASSADAVAASEAWNFSPRDACLAGTHGVVRLGGNDVIHFLQAQLHLAGCLLSNISHKASAVCLLLGRMVSTIPGSLLPQGLLTNDVAALATPEAKPLYACILNAQGRVLHDMVLYRQGGVQQR